MRFLSSQRALFASSASQVALLVAAATGGGGGDDVLLTAPTSVTRLSNDYENAPEWQMSLDGNTDAGTVMRVWLATNSGFSGGTFQYTHTLTGPELAASPPSFGFGQTYLADSPTWYARFRGENGAGNGDWSDVFGPFVVQAIPSNTAPTLSGTPAVGVPFTPLTNGTVTGKATITTNWTWLVDGETGTGTGATGTGATPPSYTPVTGDIGSTLQLRRDDTNTYGTDQATSTASTAVVAGPTFVVERGRVTNLDSAASSWNGNVDIGTAKAGRIAIAAVATQFGSSRFWTGISIGGTAMVLQSSASDGPSIWACALPSGLGGSVNVAVTGDGEAYAFRSIQILTLDDASPTAKATRRGAGTMSADQFDAVVGAHYKSDGLPTITLDDVALTLANYNPSGGTNVGAAYGNAAATGTVTIGGNPGADYPFCTFN